MTVVNELDKTLFESYVKPKATVLMGIVRGGILDGSIDWYETPQPKGTCASWLAVCMFTQFTLRDPTVRFRDTDVSRRYPCASERSSGPVTRADIECARGGHCRRSVAVLPTSQ